MTDMQSMRKRRPNTWRCYVVNSCCSHSRGILQRIKDHEQETNRLFYEKTEVSSFVNFEVDSLKKMMMKKKLAV